MKYNLLINQVKSIEWELTTSEAILFSWIYELPSWADKIDYQNKTYYYASRHLACKEVPIVSNKIDTIYRIYKKLQEKNLIHLLFIEKKDYISLTKKGQEWYKDKVTEQNPQYGKFSEAEKNPTYNNTNTSGSILDFNNNKDLNKENKHSSNKKLSFNVREDLSYVEQKYIEIWKEWLDYKDEIRKQYKTQRGAITQYNSLIKYANDNPTLANAIVKTSIEHSWDGLFALNEKQIDLFLSPKSPYGIIDQQEDDGNLIINGQRYR